MDHSVQSLGVMNTKAILPLLISSAVQVSGIMAAEPENTTASKRVLFVLTSHAEKGNTGEKTGFYLSEVTHPHHVLQNAGFQIDFVSPLGGKPPMDGKDLSDPINKAFLEDAANVNAIETTLRPSEVKASDYAAIFYAGGHGTMWDFPGDLELARIGGEIYDNGGVVAAVCHGPAGLLSIKLANGKLLVDGKDVSAFTNEEEIAVKMEGVVPFFLVDRLEALGAKHHAAGNFEKKVVVSERLVTGQNPASATGVGEEMVKLLAAPAK